MKKRLKTIKLPGGAWWTGDDDYGTRWKIYPTIIEEAAIKRDFNLHGYYDGPGKWYTENTQVIRGKFRTLVRQVHGIDI